MSLQQEISNLMRDSETCKHCQLNPEATAPFVGKAKLPLTPLTKKILKDMVEESGIPEGCCACYTVRNFLKLTLPEQMQALANPEEEEAKPETETVNLAVPIPKPYLEYLRKLAPALGITVEDLLIDPIYDYLANFFSGSYLESWIEWADRAGNPNKEALEKSINKIRPY